MTDPNSPPEGGGDLAAVEALQRLGLSSYEARVFLALQKLGTGTAREIHDVADVPRSQVYGAADSLEERGLLEIQHATPKRYRPVSLETARARLTAELERERDRAFSYLETVRRERDGDETREDVWMVRGKGPIDDRVVELADRATTRLLFAADTPDLVPPELVEDVERLAAADVAVVVASANPDVRALFEATEALTLEVAGRPGEFTGRVLLADDDVILLSVTGDRDSGAETAIWSAGTAMASVLVRVTYDGITALTSRDLD